MVPALSFVPEIHLKASFEMVVEDLCQTIDNCKLERVSEQTDELLSYFRKTYLKGEGLVEQTNFPNKHLAHLTVFN